MYSNRNIITAGKVNADPTKKNNPGNVINVALYKILYIGA